MILSRPFFFFFTQLKYQAYGNLDLYIKKIFTLGIKISLVVVYFIFDFWVYFFFFVSLFLYECSLFQCMLSELSLSPSQYIHNDAHCILLSFIHSSCIKKKKKYPRICHRVFHFSLSLNILLKRRKKNIFF